MGEVKKNILITGSSGMLGWALIQQLASLYYNLIGIDIKETADIQFFFNCDITQKSQLLSLVNKIRPHIIIHAAAYTDVDGCELNPDLAFRINSQGTKNVVLASQEIGAFLIYISTDYVFDGKKKKPYKEIDNPCPINIYGKSKLRGEEYVKSLSNRYLIIRTSRLFGKNDDSFVDKIIKLSKEKKELNLVNDQISSPTYTSDLAKAIKKIIAFKPLPQGIYHITNKGSCSWYEFARVVLKFAKIKDVRLNPIRSYQFKRTAPIPQFSVLDNSRFIKLVNRPLRNWQEAVFDYLK